MSYLELRPRFKKSVDLDPQTIIERMHSYAGIDDRMAQVFIVENHITLSILMKEQHYWSPQLSLEIEQHGQGSIIRGLYGPAPKVWTMFMFLYTGFGFIALIGLMYGLAQWSLDMKPLALWVALGAVTFEIITFLIARTGKKLASAQMLLLQNEFNMVLKKKS